MFSSGYIVLVIFVTIRVLLAIGVVYLIIAEIRRYKKRDKNGKDSGNSDTGQSDS